MKKMYYEKRTKKIVIVAVIVIICCILTFIIVSLMPNRTTYRTKENQMTYQMEAVGEESYKVSVYNSKGAKLYEEEYLREPQITQIGEHTMLVTVGAGDACSSVFINEETGEISEAYDVAAAYSEQIIVYGTYEDGQMKIIIRDIYDKDKCYKEITDTFADTAVGHYLIKDAEITDDSSVNITYYIGDWEEKSTVVVL